MNTNRFSVHSGYIGLLFLLVLTLFVIGGCNGLSLFSRHAFKSSLYERINIMDKGGNSYSIADENEMAFYAEAFNSAKTIDTEVSLDSMPEYRITLEGKKERNSKHISLYVDSNLEKRSFFIISDSTLKQIDEIYFGNILVNPVFDSLYSYGTPPPMFILSDSINTPIDPYSYDWSYIKSDLKYYQRKRDQPEKHEGINLLITDSKLPAFDLTPEPDTVKLDFKKDDTVVFSTTDIQNDDFFLEDGFYQCSLELIWPLNSNDGFYGKAIYKFDVQIDNPPEFEISADKIYPGELLVITASNINADENVVIETDINFKPNVFGEGSKKVILLPISYYHQEGKIYNINISAGDTSKTFKVELLKKDFITQYLTIDTKIAAETRNDASAQEVVDKINPLRPVCDPEKYWEGAFIQPVEGGRVSPADFGKRRHVNNAPTSYRHNGLDIGQDQGTPVKAVNHGRVLLADYLIGTGNTVIIEHGYGLKSWYYHMVSLNTKEGDMVKKRDIIGLVGSTGFSTGPHLHLSISVNDVYVNPMPFFEEGVPLQ